MTSSVTRRGFLRASACATVATAWGRISAAEESPAVVVGAHPWVYAAKLPEHDITPRLEEIFADMAYAGMAGIELMHTALRHDDAVERIGRYSEQHSLPVIGSSYSAAMWDSTQHTAILDDAKRVVSRLAELGGKTLGVSVGDARRRKTSEELDCQAGLLQEIMAVAEPQGVIVNLHNHTYEVRDSMFDLRETLKRIPEARLGPDLDWLVQADVDPIAFIREFGDRLVFLHLRDQKADKTWVEAMGEGDMDYAAVAKVLREVNFQGYAIVELAHPWDMEPTRPLRESLKMSREYVRATLGY